MGKYKKCPRCELNWIPNEEELCEVCKAELGRASKISLLEDEDDEDITGLGEKICPVCKVNYIDVDEDMCSSCRAARTDKDIEKTDEDDSWREYIDDEEPITQEDDETEVSLSQLQEEEFDEDEEEEESPIDDFEELDDSDLEFDDDDEDCDDEDFEE